MKQTGKKESSKKKPTVEHADALCHLKKKPKRFSWNTWIKMPMIARYTGMRAGEVSALSSSHVINEQGVLCLQVKSGKTASSARLIPVCDKLLPVIQECLSTIGPWFHDVGDSVANDGVRMAAKDFLKWWNKAAKSVGPYSFHCLRLYCNDELVRAGVDILDRERILGHVNSRTQAAYTAVDLERFKAALDQVR